MSDSVLHRHDFVKCAAFLTAVTGRPMTEEQLEAYYELLADIPYEVLKVACKRAAQESQTTWLPAVGLIRKYAVEEIYGQLPLAADEWERVRELIRHYGYPRPVEAINAMPPLTRDAVRAIGGWIVICDSENPSVTGGQFRMAYESLARREMEMRQLSPDVRPAIIAGPKVTPQLHDERRDNIRNIVQDCAAKLKTG